MSVQIHPTAIVDPGAVLESDVSIGAYSIVGPGVHIGRGTTVAAHVVIERRTIIGPNNKLYPFCSLGCAPQDLKYAGEESFLEIGESNSIREFVTLHPGTKTGRMKTVIGNKNLFMANSHVAHDCIVGNHNVFANSVALAGHVEIGNGTILGGMVGIHQFARVGDMAFIGAGAMVSNDVPPYSMAQGDRCHLRGLNLIGLRRAGFSASDVGAIKRVHRALFWRGGPLDEKLAELEPELRDLPFIQNILKFAKESKRGCITPRRGATDFDDSDG